MVEGTDPQKQIEELIDELESYAEKSPWYLPNKIVIPDEEFFRLTQTIREILPTELSEAKSMLAKRDLILKNAQEEHRRIMESAERRLEDLTSEEQVVVVARQQSERIVEQANLEAETIRRDALSYTAELLAEFEKRVRVVLGEIEKGKVFAQQQLADRMDSDLDADEPVEDAEVPVHGDQD
jgi:valyl-tRNA synthetase